MRRLLLALVLILAASPLWAQSHPVFFNDAASLARYAKMKTDYEANPADPATLGGQGYKFIKETADAGTSYYDQNGFTPAFMYHMTGNAAYVALAWTRLQSFLGQTETCVNSGIGGNGLREYGWLNVLIYDWIYAGLTSEQRTTFLNKLNAQMVCAGNPAGRLGDSDQTIGEWGMAAMLFASTSDYNATAVTIWNDPANKIGGWDATSSDVATTRRNAIYHYITAISEGGAFLESTEYNLNTLKLLILPNAALKTAGFTKLPEIDEWQDDAGVAFIQEVTPGISTQTAPYPYLRQDIQAGGLGMMPPYRTETCLAFSGVLAGTATGAKVHDWCQRLLVRYPIATNTVTPRGFLVYDDTATVGDHTTLDRVNYNAGVGLFLTKTGWTASDSMFGVFFSPGPSFIDHMTPGISGSFKLWKNQKWAINHPIGYSTLVGSDCRGSNQVCIEGLGYGNSGPAMGYRQYRKIQAHRNDWTNGFHYMTMTDGGSTTASGAYNPPQLNLHEQTRSVVWLSNWDVLVVYDRVNADNLDLAGKSGFAAGIVSYIDASPRTSLTIHTAVSPTLAAGTIQWDYATGEGAKVYNLLPSNPTRTIVDETTSWGTGLDASQKKWHVNLEPASTLKWNKWFNVWDVYGTSTPSTVSLVQDVPNGVDATLVTKGSQSVLAAFNAIQGPDVPLNIGAIWQNIAPVLDVVRLRTTDYSLSWTSAVATKALLFDLKPSISWTYTVNGGAPVELTVDSNGIGVADIATTGAITLAVIGGGPLNPPVVVGTTVLPDAVVGTAYSQAIEATGGDDGPYVCTLDSGALPAGLSLNAACATGVTGTPDAVESANSITKTGANGYNSGAYSTNALAAGDGYVETTVAETTTARYIGLSNGNTGVTQGDIDFCAYLLANGDLDLYDFVTNNTRRYHGTYASGDVIRVAVEGGAVKYRKNGTLLYTSATAPTYPLLVDIALYHQGATLKNVVGDFGAGAVDVAWTGVTLASTGGGNTSTFAVEVCDDAPTSCATQTYTMNILSTPTITTTSLDPCVIGTPYDETVLVGGGNDPFAWSLVSESDLLPPGLNFAAGTTDTKHITGDCTTVGAYQFNVRVTDDDETYDDQLLGITVVSALAQLTVTITPGPTSAVIQYGSVNAEDDCTINLLDGETILDTVTSTGPGESSRTATFGNLTPLTPYTVDVTCESAEVSRSQFSTLATPPTGVALDWVYKLKPSARLLARGVTNAEVTFHNLTGAPSPAAETPTGTGTTYYVDCAADPGGDGSLSTPWDAIADVNGASFSAGDSVLLKAGCTFRETLTVPSSGSAGNPITFGAYGDGVAPILTGGDIITPGTAWSVSTAAFSTSWSATLATDDDFGGATDINLRVILTAAQLTTGGNKVKVTFNGHSTQGMVISGATIGVRDGVTYNFLSAPTVLTFDGGSPTKTIAAGGTATTDEITFTLDETKDHIVAWWGDNASYTKGWGAGNQYYKAGAGQSDQSQTLTVTSYSTQAAIDAVSKVETQTALTNVWQASVTTEPKVVLFNGVLGTLVASTAALVSPGQWYWAANVLYVYAESDPDTLYTAPGIEKAVRDNVIVVNAKDYITVDGLTIQQSNADVGVGVLGTTDHFTIQNCTVRYNGTDGVNFYSTPVGGSNVVNGNVVEYNRAAGVNFSTHTGSGAGTESVVSSNTIRYNGTDGIVIRGNYVIAENNTVVGNATATEFGSGIHVYSGGVGEGTGDNNIVRRNSVTGTQGSSVDGDGIAIDQWCDSNQVYYNIVFGNNGACGYLYDSAGSAVYNNVCYGNMLNNARTVKGEWELDSSASDLTSGALIKNNIFRATQANVYAITVDARTSDNAGLDITNNVHFTAASDWYYWNASGGAVLATWNALTGVGTDLNSDPLFIDAAGADFRLSPTSSAINAGVDVGLTSDYRGWGLGGLPDIGAYELSTATAACETGCTLTLPLVSGSTYQLQHVWKDAGDATVATGRIGTVAVP